MSTRGFHGIALYEPKFIENHGTILRTAQAFGADLIYLIGDRYRGPALAGDTGKSHRHVPTIRLATLEDFWECVPRDTEVIPVEVDGDWELPDYAHPERAIYLFGGEDRTLPRDLYRQSPVIRPSIRIETSMCLNQAVTASIVLYDRHAKEAQKRTCY